jgi:hypothetical protein
LVTGKKGKKKGVNDDDEDLGKMSWGANKRAYYDADELVGVR